MKADTNIVVASTRMDDFGSQFITSTDEVEYKIGAKREHLHSLAQVGTPLILKWDNYKNQDYVKDVLVNASGAQSNPAAPVTPRPVAAVTPPGNKDAQIARAVALKAGVDNTTVGVDPKVIIAQAKEFLPFLMGTPTLTEHAKALVKEGVLESAVVDQAALKGLAAIAKDAKEWVGTVAEKNQWLKDTAKEMFGKDIKEITEDELGDLTGRLAEHIKKQQTEDNPF
ncbi:hypothetical protein LCGC14_1407700 [marine sediment metagenome]|uniref:Uncharacterized protein n=1 Tax=marine sediment metagenome TaxID=412755 RepID=A0A0F9MWU2_9ZZZZ